MTQYPNLSSLQANAGQELGVSNWLEITQTMVNTFGEVTQDQQWIQRDVDVPTRQSTESTGCLVSVCAVHETSMPAVIMHTHTFAIVFVDMCWSFA